MIDHCTLWIAGEFARVVNGNEALEFIGQHSKKHGDIKEQSNAKLGQFRFGAVSEDFASIKGSLHQLHHWINSGIWSNHDQFTWLELFDSIHWIGGFSGVPPEHLQIHGIEIGLNLENPPFEIATFLDSLLLHRTKRFIPYHSGLGCSVKHGHYEFKCYDKGRQSDAAAGMKVLRIECKITRMQCIKALGIKTMADLLDPFKLERLYEWMFGQSKHLLVFDPAVELEKLNEPDREFWKEAENPKYWKGLTTKQIEKRRERLHKIAATHCPEPLLASLLHEMNETFLTLTDGADDYPPTRSASMRERGDSYRASLVCTDQDREDSYRAAQDVRNVERGDSYRAAQDVQDDERGDSYRVAQEVKNEDRGDSYHLDEGEEFPPVSQDVSLSLDTDSSGTSIGDPPQSAGPCSDVETWRVQVTELESVLSTIELPTEPVRLNGFTVIVNVRTFIQRHLATVKAHLGNRRFKPYLDRLSKVIKRISGRDL